MKTIDNYMFGDIVAAQIPFSDGGETKIRPMLILSKDKDDYLMMRITSNVLNKGTYDIIVIPDATNKLRADSLCKIKKIGNFSKELLLQRIGALSQKHRQIIKKELGKFIDSL